MKEAQTGKAKWYYIYVLRHTKTKKCFYVGSSTNTESRLLAHRVKFGNKIKLIVIQKIFTTPKNAQKIERYWVNQLSYYGSDLHNINHHTTRDKKKKIIKPPKPKPKKYQKKLIWITITDQEKRKLFTKLSYGNYTTIAKSVNKNAETIRRLFSIKPNKIISTYYDAILKFKKKQAEKGNVKEPDLAITKK